MLPYYSSCAWNIISQKKTFLPRVVELQKVALLSKVVVREFFLYLEQKCSEGSFCTLNSSVVKAAAVPRTLASRKQLL